jgi:hypothetical protein
MQKLMIFSIFMMLAFTVVGAYSIATSPDRSAIQVGGPRINTVELTVPTATLQVQQFEAM